MTVVYPVAPSRQLPVFFAKLRQVGMTTLGAALVAHDALFRQTYVPASVGALPVRYLGPKTTVPPPLTFVGMAALLRQAYERHVAACEPPPPRKRYAASWVLARAVHRLAATTPNEVEAELNGPLGGPCPIVQQARTVLVAGHHRHAVPTDVQDHHEGAGGDARRPP